MTTRELVKAEIENLSDEALDELYPIIKGLAQCKDSKKQPGLLARLKQIKIDAPPDFAANLDQYLSGEKRAE